MGAGVAFMFECAGCASFVPSRGTYVLFRALALLPSEAPGLF